MRASENARIAINQALACCKVSTDTRILDSSRYRIGLSESQSKIVAKSDLKRDDVLKTILKLYPDSSFVYFWH
jgi:hypothetical protein